MAVTSASLLLVGGEEEGPTGSELVLQPDTALLVTGTGQAFLLDMADHFYALPPPAAAMLQATLQRGPSEAVRDIVARYDVDPDVAEHDLRRFIDDLRQRAIVRRRGDDARRAPRSHGATAIAAFGRARLRRPGPARRRAATVLLAVRLSMLLFGWRATLAAWTRAIRARPPAGAAADRTYDTIDDAIRSASAWLPTGMTCKERALGAWAMARMAGRPATLVVGVTQHPLGAHAWCEAGPAMILGDDPAVCRRHLPVFRYE